MLHNKTKVVKAAAFLLLPRSPSTSSGKKRCQSCSHQNQWSIHKQLLCMCTVLGQVFITVAISGLNDSWPVCSLIINIKGTGEKKETICLDLAQNNIHQAGLSGFTTNNIIKKPTANQQQKSSRSVSGLIWWSIIDFSLQLYSPYTENKMKVTLFAGQSLSFWFSSVAPLTDHHHPPLSLRKGNSFPLPFFLTAMRFRNSSAQRFRGLGFKTSFVNHCLGAACERPINSEHRVKLATTKSMLQREPNQCCPSLNQKQLDLCKVSRPR